MIWGAHIGKNLTDIEVMFSQHEDIPIVFDLLDLITVKILIIIIIIIIINNIIIIIIIIILEQGRIATRMERIHYCSNS